MFLIELDPSHFQVALFQFFFPVSVDKRLKPKQLNGEKVYSGLQLQTPAHHSREVTEVGASAGHIPPAGSDKCVLSPISPF